MKKVTAVVVTYNRKELLMECLDALLSQTRPVDRILLINNASTDGTLETLEEKGYLKNEVLQVVNMATNTGGAGGFTEGLAQAARTDADYVWVMDDDTIPEARALEKLCHAWEKIPGPISFLASAVFGPAGEPMNVPKICMEKAANGYQDWYRYLEHTAIRVDNATFVSLLFDRQAIKACGLPCKDYFIWGDDYEYTQRLIRHYGKAYMIGDSRVCHKRFGATNLDLSKETAEGRVRMYYYFYRNGLINRSIYDSKKETLRFALSGVRTSLASLRRELGPQKFLTVYKGIGGFIKWRRAYVRYIEKQLKKGC